MLSIFFPIFFLVFPQLFLIEALDKNIFKGFGIFVCVALLIGTLINFSLCILLLTLFGPLILAFHYLIKKGVSPKVTMSVVMIVFFISMIICLNNVGFSPTYLKSDDFIKNIYNLSAKFNINFESTAYIKILINRYLQILPAIITIISLSITYITYTLTGTALLKRGKLIVQPYSYMFIRLPRGFVIAFLAIGILMVYGDKIIGNNYLILVDNLIYIFKFVIFLVGVSFILYSMQRIKINKVIRFFTLMLILFIPSLESFIIGIGITEQIFNFRKLPR